MQNVTLKIIYFFRAIRISEFLRLTLRVGCPLVGQDLKVTEGRPPEVLP